MSGLDDLMSKIPMDQLAQRLGVDEPTAERATRRAVPALVGGMQANAKDRAGAASLHKALGKHRHQRHAGKVDVDKVDTAEGEKIVQNVFGGNKDQVVNRLVGSGDEGGSGVMGKLLPMLAPIVMSQVAEKLGGSDSSGSDKSGGGLSDLLGGMLGGSEHDGPGGMLGGLLGGGRR
jgi:hypothetical protein